MVRSRLLVLGVSFALVAACSSSSTSSTIPEDQAIGEEGAEVADVEGDTENLGVLSVADDGSVDLATNSLPATGLTIQGLGILADDGGLDDASVTEDDASADEDAAAGDAGVEPTKGPRWSPPGCVTQERKEGNKLKGVVERTYTGCTGPRGLASVTGKIRIEHEFGAGGTITLTISNVGDIKVNQSTVTSWTAKGIGTPSGNAVSVAWEGALEGTTRRGKTFKRTNKKTFAFSDDAAGNECMTIDGTSEGSVGVRTLSTTFAGYKRCKGNCPESGSIKIVTGTGRSMQIDYKGENKASITFTGANGTSTSKDITLACALAATK